MSISFAFFTFLNAFWIMALFAAPLSVRYTPDTKGYTPESINWKKLLTLAFLLAVLVTASLAMVINSKLLPLK